MEQEFVTSNGRCNKIFYDMHEFTRNSINKKYRSVA